jgi:hypothetical protein
MSFGLNEKELHATIDKMEDGKKIQSLLASNEPVYVSHFRSIFEDLWKNGVDAADIMMDMEKGIESSKIEVIHNPNEALSRAYKLIGSSKKDVSLLFSTANAFRR